MWPPIRLLSLRCQWNLLGFSLAMALAHSALAAPNNPWQVQIGKRVTIELRGKKVKLARTLATRLRLADEAVFLPFQFTGGPGKLERWLIVRASSRPGGGEGFCGAGYEDHLVLVEVSGSSAKSVGVFQAQSCLESVSMHVDQFEALVSSLHQDPKDGTLAFQQTLSNENAATGRAVTIRVLGGRMKVESQRVNELL